MSKLKLGFSIIFFFISSFFTAVQANEYLGTWQYKHLSLEIKKDGTFASLEGGKAKNGTWLKQADNSLILKMDELKTKKLSVKMTNSGKLKFTSTRLSSNKSSSFIFEKQKFAFTESPEYKKSINAQAPKNLSIDQTTQNFFAAFKKAELATMSQYFSSEILFLGDHKFFYENTKPDIVRKKTKSELIIAYHNLFNKVGLAKWSKLLNKVKPTLESYVTGDEYNKLLKTGLFKKDDILFDIHFREGIKLKRVGLDEAVIFVFRKVNDRYLVVGHFADY